MNDRLGRMIVELVLLDVFDLIAVSIEADDFFAFSAIFADQLSVEVTDFCRLLFRRNCPTRNALCCHSLIVR